MEGATDFLWMAGLAALHAIGFEIALAAAALNALGMGVILAILARLRGRADALFFACACAVLLSGGTAAALGGFSTLAYGGLFSLLLYCALQANIPAVLTLSLLMALFRPDGVILGSGVVLALFFQSTKTDRVRMLWLSLPAILLGSAYFLWRMQYFGMPLPLPLLVKQKVDNGLEGFWNNYHALKLYAPLALLLALRLVWGHGLSRSRWREAVLILLGPALLFLALCLAHQSQNVGNRFQFPVVLALLFLAAHTLPPLRSGWRHLLLLVLVFWLPCQGGLRIIKKDVRYLTNDDYINVFPQRLRLDGFIVDSIALTEAGRFPYWYDANRMIDLVGLNSRQVVQQGAPAVLEQYRPELIFIHHAGRFASRCPEGEPFCLMPAADLKLAGPYNGNNPVLLAPAAALDFAVRHGYQAVMVRYGQDDAAYQHVYFLSPRLDMQRFLASLDDSFVIRASYADSVQLLKPD